MGKIYDNINDAKRAKLIDLVLNEGVKIVNASEYLKINYSSAKTIMRIYRKEKRINKKVKPSDQSSNEERKLNNLLKQYGNLWKIQSEILRKINLIKILGEINMYTHFFKCLKEEISRSEDCLNKLFSLLDL